MSWLAGRTIHQVVTSASPRDAITNSVLEIRAMLRQYGPSEVFALNTQPELLDEIHEAHDYPDFIPRDPDPLTVIHVSMGDDRFLPFVMNLPGRFIVSYHNVTPAKYFAAWDYSTARRLDAGRRYLEALRDRTALAFSDSEFSAADLRAAGYSKIRIGGLILGREALLGLRPENIDAPAEGPVALSVGQIYPHKRPDLLIAAFHQLVTRHRPDAHLVLAGVSRLPSYTDALIRYVHRLGLAPCVTLTGSISDGELVGWYRRADLFVTASEHEGFCVPVVEAMLFDLPVIARANGAVPETVGDAGVLVAADASPTVMAKVMREVLSDAAAADALRARGRARREQFSDASCRKRFLDGLEELPLCAS